jgi:hypothetical protein
MDNPRLAVLAGMFGVPNIIFTLRAKNNPDWQPPNVVIGIRFATIGIVVFMPLMFLVFPNPPVMGQPLLGLIQFIYLAACYLVLWLIWKRTNDWRMKFYLLIFFIFLPDFLWIINVAPLLPENGGRSWLPRFFAGIQLLYFLGGYFVFKHYFPKIRASASVHKQPNPSGRQDAP